MPDTGPLHITVDAVLFDLDGTLADSTAGVDRSWRKLADRLGIDFVALNGSYHGVPAVQTMQRLMPNASPAEISDLCRWLADIEVADTDDIVPVPGALTLLNELASAPWAVVTSGTHRLATARMVAAGIPQPPVLVTADDITIGKPDPEPYLLAAHRLGVAPKRCLVVEDAPAGVASGLASGATVLGVLTTHSDLGVPSVPDFTELAATVDGPRVTIHRRAHR